MHKILHQKKGFTLIEIMVVVAIIGLIAAFAVPAIQRNRVITQARGVMQEAKILDDATQQYLTEYNLPASTVPAPSDLVNYVKPGTALYTRLSAGTFTDPYGNLYSVSGSTVTIAAETIQDFPTSVTGTGTGVNSFWFPYESNN